jgi:hypothetical protein
MNADFSFPYRGYPVGLSSSKQGLEKKRTVLQGADATVVPVMLNRLSLPGLTRQSIDLRKNFFAKKVDARVPQTSLRSLRKLDCVPAHDGGERRFNSSGL